MLENYNALEAFVDAYMAANGIDPKYKDELMESVLLWHGYEPLPWDYHTNEMTRAFCEYLQKENPYLFNFFERGLYLNGDGSETIDLTYMMGMMKAFQGEHQCFKHLNNDNARDIGLFNAFIEAFRSANRNGGSPYQALGEFLNNYVNGNYDPQQKYNEFLNYPYEVRKENGENGLNGTSSPFQGSRAWLEEDMQDQLGNTDVADAFWDNFDKHYINKRKNHQRWG